MVMYSIYNSDTLVNLINTVHKMHNQTTRNENLFSGKLHQWYNWYSTRDGINQYAINSIIFENVKREICPNVYKIYQSITNIHKGYMNSFEGLFAHFTFTTIIITRNFRQSQKRLFRL